MRKFLLGLFVGFVLTAITGVIFVFAFARLGEAPPSIPSEGVLVLRLSGDIPETPPVSVPLLEPAPALALFQAREAILRAATDDRIRALVLRPQGLSIGWGKLAELRSAIAKFKESKKPVYAYLKAPRARDYLLSLAADRIYLTPEDLLDVKGLRIEAMYLGGTLEKLGVDLEVERIGKYKDAADTFTRKSMAEETRQVLNSLLDQLFADMVGSIATARKLDEAQVRALIDQGPFLAEDARAGGLVDELVYEDQFEERVVKATKLEEYKAVSGSAFYRATSASGSRKNQVALLVAEGNIVRSAPESVWGSEVVLASNQFRQTAEQIAKNDDIKAVIVRVDSPGGDAFASDEMLHALKVLRKKKPVVISMSDTAASGGYYIALTGDPVLAYENTVTGSIGVIYGKVNLRKLYDKIGAQKEIMTRGRFAAADSDYTPLDPAARQKLRNSVEATYRRFVSLTAEARNRSYEDIHQVAQGRVWLGAQAKQEGLLDELGGLDRAIQIAKEKAKIDPKEEVRLTVYPRPKSFLERLTQSGGQWVRGLPLIKEAATAAESLNWNHQILRMMPYSIEIQ